VLHRDRYSADQAGAVMRDDVEQLLKRVSDRVPEPSPETTFRVRERVLRTLVPRRPSRSAQRALLVAAVFLLVGGTGFGAGYWTGPTQTAADLTIGARPDSVPAQLSTQVTLFGTVPSGRAGDSVQVEANECGLSGHFHELEGVRTEAQGVWSLPVPHFTPGTVGNNNNAWVTTKTSFRVRWNNRTSDEVTVNARPSVAIYQYSRKVKDGKRQFAIIIIAPQIKYRPKVLVERQIGATWKAFAKVVVPITGLFGGRSHGVKVWLRAAKGQVLRLRITAAEAAPCYLAETGPPSRPIR
jgi:hypothetical protein